MMCMYEGIGLVRGRRNGILFWAKPTLGTWIFHCLISDFVKETNIVIFGERPENDMNFPPPFLSSMFPWVRISSSKPCGGITRYFDTTTEYE